jgi:hypothetical protein
VIRYDPPCPRVSDARDDGRAGLHTRSQFDTIRKPLLSRNVSTTCDCTSFRSATSPVPLLSSVVSNSLTPGQGSPWVAGAISHLYGKEKDPKSRCHAQLKETSKMVQPQSRRAEWHSETQSTQYPASSDCWNTDSEVDSGAGGGRRHTRIECIGAVVRCHVRASPSASSHKEHAGCAQYMLSQDQCYQ